MLVAFMIETLQGLNLKNVEDIQIILSTHSPFILSDIPMNDILMIKDGEQTQPDEESETFCANVYDILNNQLFMSRFVGDFANSKINDVIEVLKSEEALTEQGAIKIKNDISLIGDSFLRGMLQKKLNQRQGHD